MAKGVLLELDGRKAVVLTPQGEFKRVAVPKGDWGVGDEVDFAETRTVPWARWGLAAAAAAVMLVVPIGYQGYVNAQPLALVTVDINPSLRLTLNSKEQVLNAEGLNQDGAMVLQGIDWKRQPVGEVLAEVTAHAIAANKLNIADESSAVVVAVAPAKSTDLPAVQADTIAADARTAVQTEVAKQGMVKNVEPKTNLTVLQATLQEKQEAEAKGLTPGQYLIFQEIQKELPDANVQPDQLKQMGPGKLLKSLQVNPGSIFGEAEQHHGTRENRGQSGKQGSGPDAQQPSEPASGKPGNQGNGNAKDPVTPGQNPGAQATQPDDKGKAGEQGKSDDKGKPDEKAQPGEQGKSDDKGRSDEKGKSGDKGKSDSKGNNSPDKHGTTKHSSDNWTVPFFEVQIPKPAFLRNKDKAAETDEPRAETPGAESAGDKNTQDGNSGTGNSDKGDADKGNSDKGNSDKGNSDKGNSDKGNSDKGNSDKGNSDKGNSDNGNGQASGNNDGSRGNKGGGKGH